LRGVTNAAAQSTDPIVWVFNRNAQRISYPYPRKASASADGDRLRVARDVSIETEMFAAGLKPIYASQRDELGIGGPLDPHRGKAIRVVENLRDLGVGELVQAILGTGDARVLREIAAAAWPWGEIPAAANKRLAEIRSGTPAEPERRSADFDDGDVLFDLGEV
jgi:hypothetical protein